MWIVCQADDSHKMSSLIFSETKKNRMPCATECAWSFKGLIILLFFSGIGFMIVKYSFLSDMQYETVNPIAGVRVGVPWG